MVDGRLHGKRILVTRELDRAKDTARAIEMLGGKPVVFPVIRTAAPTDAGPIDRAIESLGRYDWVVVSSVNGVRALFDTSDRIGVDPRSAEGTAFAAVGRITASALKRRGITEVLVPDKQDADGLAGALVDAGAKGTDVLVLRAEKGRDTVIDRLEQVGARVDMVTAYRTVCCEPTTQEVSWLLDGPGVDAALFLSPSAFVCFTDILGEVNSVRFLGGTLLAAVGPVTARAMEERGFRPDLVPAEPSVDAILEAVSCEIKNIRPQED